MKALIQQILKAVPARTGKQLFRQNEGQKKSTAFQPAPSYWALIPVKVQASVPPGRNRRME